MTVSNGRKIAFCAYRWGQDPNQRLDPYLSSFVEAFSNVGFEVHVYFADNYITKGKVIGLRNFDLLAKKFKSNRYEIVLSINNALLTERLVRLFNCKIISLIVDDFNHLFNHDSIGKYDSFELADHIVFSSYAHINELITQKPDLKDKVRFYPTATNITDSYDRTELEKGEFSHEISWVASYLDAEPWSLLFKNCMRDEGKRLQLCKALNAVRNGTEIDFKSKINGISINDILDLHKWTASFFEMQLQNSISNEMRLGAIKKLGKHGLVVYGNDSWSKAICGNASIAETIKSANFIENHHDLMKIYNSSRICINVPQIQSSGALPYRVVDILASEALLITSFHENSDLFKIFGENCPIVTYRNMEELEELCLFYLSNEQKRKSKVREANKLVKEGFDFQDRCIDLLSIANICIDKQFEGNNQISYYSPNRFIADLSRFDLKRMLVSSIKLVFSLVFSKFSINQKIGLIRLLTKTK